MIKTVNLINFKSFQNVQIPFKNLTVFTGINGMGKSTCIQSLLLLRQSYQLGRLNESGGLFLDGEFSKPGNGRDIFFAGAGDQEKLGIDIIFHDGQNTSFQFNYSKDSDLQPTFSIPAKHFDYGQSSLFNDNFFYLNADRLNPERDVFPASQSNIQKGNLGKNGQYTVHYISNNQRNPLNIPALKHPLAQTDNLIDNIDAWLRDITPGIRVKSQFYPELNSSRLGYTYDIESGVTEEFKPSNVGYGITYILPIITQLLIAKPGQIIIIENPESHLHPTGQSVIAKLCCLAAENGVQVILETHSDHIINGILVSIFLLNGNADVGIQSSNVKILFIERDIGEYVSKLSPIDIELDGRIKNAPLNFFDQFSKDMKTIMGF